MSSKRKRIIYSSVGIGILAGCAVLFFYIEERKYEALYYQTELEKLQKQHNGIHYLIDAVTSHGSTIADIKYADSIRRLSPEQAAALLKALNTDSSKQLQRDYKLSAAEVESLRQLFIAVPTAP